MGQRAAQYAVFRRAPFLRLKGGNEKIGREGRTNSLGVEPRLRLGLGSDLTDASRKSQTSIENNVPKQEREREREIRESEF